MTRLIVTIKRHSSAKKILNFFEYLKLLLVKERQQKALKRFVFIVSILVPTLSIAFFVIILCSSTHCALIVNYDIALFTHLPGCLTLTHNCALPLWHFFIIIITLPSQLFVHYRLPFRHIQRGLNRMLWNYHFISALMFLQLLGNLKMFQHYFTPFTTLFFFSTCHKSDTMAK